MLRRIGNKSKLLPKLLPLFPENITTFIDMFMGSGAVTFAMVDRCKYVIANDNDDNVYNLFMVLKEHKEELVDALTTMPVHERLFKHWVKTGEEGPIWKAARFLMLSNFSLLGQGDTLHFGQNNNKHHLLNNIKQGFRYIAYIQFMNSDFRDVLSKIAWRDVQEKSRGFVYADPPYLETGNNYAESFIEDDTRDLFSILISSGLRFAVSEFRHPLVMALAEDHGLHVTSLGERCNLKNRREEILITNYDPNHNQRTIFDMLEN